MIRRSDSQGELATALAGFQSEMGVVPKGSVNPFFKSNYADLADCVKTAMPVHTKHGLSVTQDPSQDELGRPTLITTLMHTSGEWKESEAVLYLTKEDSQAQGSAITYMRRYAYCAVLGIVADVDDDGNAATAAAAGRATEANPADSQHMPRPPSSAPSPAQLAALEKIHTTRQTDFQAGSLARWGKSPDKLIKQEASRWLDELNGKVKPPEVDAEGRPF